MRRGSSNLWQKSISGPKTIDFFVERRQKRETLLEKKSTPSFSVSFPSLKKRTRTLLSFDQKEGKSCNQLG